MSENRLKRTNLLNNDSLANNKRFDRLSSDARRDRDRGATCAGLIAIEPLKRCATVRSSGPRPDLARSI
jgi:hypothetical protein